MALASIPPWLNLQPEMHLEALRAGGALGASLASTQQRAVESAQQINQENAALAARIQEANANRELARWELEQKLQQQAMDLAADRERFAAGLEETRRYHMATEEEAARGNDIRAQHYAALEAQAKSRLGPAGERIHFGEHGRVTMVNPDGTVKVLEPGNAPARAIEGPGGKISVWDPDEPSKLIPISEGQLSPADTARAYNMMIRRKNEFDPNDPAYLARSNAAWNILNPRAGPQAGTSAAPALISTPESLSNAPAIPPIPTAPFSGMTPRSIVGGPQGGAKVLTRAIAEEFWRQAKGDRKKAEALARAAGYTF